MSRHAPTSVLQQEISPAPLRFSSDPSTVVRHFPSIAAASERPAIQGRFLSVRGRRFWIKGITDGTFRPNQQGEPFPERAIVRDDFQRMRDSGVNTVRLYTPPPDWLADLAADAGLFLFPDICWGPRRCDHRRIPLPHYPRAERWAQPSAQSRDPSRPRRDRRLPR